MHELLKLFKLFAVVKVTSKITYCTFTVLQVTCRSKRFSPRTKVIKRSVWFLFTYFIFLITESAFELLLLVLFLDALCWRQHGRSFFCILNWKKLRSTNLAIHPQLFIITPPIVLSLNSVHTKHRKGIKA